MRVIHVTAYYAPAFVYGGPVRSIHALCKAQQDRGLDVAVFTTNAAGGDRLPVAPRGSHFEGVRVHYFELSAPAMLLGAAELPLALKRSLRYADVVHLHGLFNRTVWEAATVLHNERKPYVLSTRGMLEAPALAHHRWRKRLTWHLKDRQIVDLASVLHATSSTEAMTLRQHHAGARVVEIPNPVAAASLSSTDPQAWRRSTGIPADAPIVLSLGRLHRIKRLDLVAESFLELRRHVPDAHLVIAGTDEQHLRPALEAQLAPAADAVHWVGQVDGERKSELLAAATVLVQCSDSESFGMSVAEALAAATPVVVTRTCPWEAVQQVGCGFWVEQSATAIADALVTVTTNPELAAEQGRIGRRFVAEQMSPAHVAEAWQGVYQDAVRLKTAAA